ncbi:MAG TPA: hypothetical protein VFY93_08095 [Planctomycetota bacterium]|nr:hypothetical protein [Planctomycetota bacterium]
MTEGVAPPIFSHMLRFKRAMNRKKRKPKAANRNRRARVRAKLARRT